MSKRRYGGFWRRSCAMFIDKVILHFVTLFLFLIGLLALGRKGNILELVLDPSGDITQGIGIVGLLYLAASLLAGLTYFTWFHGIGGRTPGKMLLDLRVVQASGDPMTPGLAFLRWVGYLISAPVFCLGFLWVAFDSRKQGWHDKLAATLVVRETGEFTRTGNGIPLENTVAGTTTFSGGTFGAPPPAAEQNPIVPLEQKQGPPYTDATPTSPQ
jgi:uncharacterized RDD family membrane protein YckC